MAQNISYYQKVQKLWSGKFNIQKQCKAMLASLPVTRTKELEEPNNNFPFAHKLHLKNCMGYILMLCWKPDIKPARLQLLK